MHITVELNDDVKVGFMIVMIRDHLRMLAKNGFQRCITFSPAYVCVHV